MFLFVALFGACSLLGYLVCLLLLLLFCLFALFVFMFVWFGMLPSLLTLVFYSYFGCLPCGLLYIHFVLVVWKRDEDEERG